MTSADAAANYPGVLSAYSLVAGWSFFGFSNAEFSGAGQLNSHVDCTRDQQVGVRSPELSVRGRDGPRTIAVKRECTMMNFRLIGATAFSLMLAAPAMAANVGYEMHDTYHGLYSHHSLPAQDAIRFGYGEEYPTYHSGWGGLYGDGEYPGSVDDNMGPPYRSR